MNQRLKKILNGVTIFILVTCFSLLFAGKTMSLESVESHRLKMLDGNRKSLVIWYHGGSVIKERKKRLKKFKPKLNERGL